MKKYLSQVILLVSLIALTGCDKEMPEPAPSAPVEGVVGTPEVFIPDTANPAKEGSNIDEQIGELRKNNGDIPQEERDRLNNVPAIPDVFDK